MIGDVTPQLREEIRRARARFVDLICDQVVRTGVALVTLDERLDDPPVHPIAEFALIAHEYATRGRIPDLSKGSLWNDLSTECSKRGWRIIRDQSGRALLLVLSAKCSRCDGKGRIISQPSIPAYWGELPEQVTMTAKVCDKCNGLGKEERANA